VGGALVAGWAALIYVFPPSRQDFPLGDDFAFSESAIRLTRGEGIHYGEHASMPLLGQWLWAAPFLWLGSGCPHFALRMSTVLLSGLGLWAFYDLLRHEGLDPGQSGFLTAVLAFNPLYFLLQGTFMSDVPALSFSLIALALYRRAIDSRHLLTLLAASVAALLAVSTRQSAIAVPLAIALVLGFHLDLRKQWSWRLALALPLAAGVGIHIWFTSRSDIWPIKPTWQFNLFFLASLGVVAQMVALLLLPALLESAFSVDEGWVKLGLRLGISILGSTAVAGALYYWATWRDPVRILAPSDDLDSWFPYTMPMLGAFGPFSAVVGHGPISLSAGIREVLTIVGVIAAGALAARILTRPLEMLSKSPLFIYSFLQGALFILSPKIYDRYFVVLLPGALAAIGLRSRVPLARRALGWLALAAMAALSVGLMHDWLSWNEARWALGRKAVANGIHPWLIDGGLEWNGWYARATQPDLPPAPKNSPGPSLSQVYNHDLHFADVIGHYALASEVPANAKVRDQRTYSLWLPPREQRFYLIEYTETEEPANQRTRY
jgi:hypothetical protein